MRKPLVKSPTHADISIIQTYSQHAEQRYSEHIYGNLLPFAASFFSPCAFWMPAKVIVHWMKKLTCTAFLTFLTHPDIDIFSNIRIQIHACTVEPTILPMQINNCHDSKSLHVYHLPFFAHITLDHWFSCVGFLTNAVKFFGAAFPFSRLSGGGSSSSCSFRAFRGVFCRLIALS